jgi:hypothetical protein
MLIDVRADRASGSLRLPGPRLSSVQSQALAPLRGGAGPSANPARTALFFQILRVRIDPLQIVGRAHDVAGGHQPGYHRVVLVVVLVHAVAADQLQIGHLALDEFPDHVDRAAIVSVVNQIRGSLADHRSVNHLRFLGEPELRQLTRAQCYEVRVGRTPHRIRIEAEILPATPRCSAGPAPSPDSNS